MELTFWEKRFCEEYASNGGKAAQAYQAARPECAISTSKVESCRTLQKPHIQARIEELRKGLVVSSFLTASERRQFLADLTRANPQTVMGDKPHLAQSVTVTRRITDSGEVEEKVQVKLPDKLKAIQLDAQMAGELAPATNETGELAPVANALEALMGLALPTSAPLTLPAPPPPVDDGEDLL
jgi:phage terminase small subunit